MNDDPLMLTRVWNNPPKVGEVLDTVSGCFEVTRVVVDENRPYDIYDGFGGPAVQSIHIPGTDKFRTYTRYAVYGVRTKKAKS